MEKALVIIDIQKDYFESGKMALHGSEEASLNAKRLLEDFRAKKWPIIFIQHLSTRPDASFFIPSTDGAMIHPNVEPLSNEYIVIKHYPNSFRETELLDLLKKYQIKDLVICGMMTHMCIDATTRAAKDLGFNIQLIGDACATKDLEIEGNVIKAKEVHHSFLAALNYFYADVIQTDSFLNS